MTQSPEDDFNDDDYVSKSQRKRDANAIFDLARQLADMSENKLSQLPLDEDVLRALKKARKIKAHVARKRELQHVAKIMRGCDMEPVQTALNADAETRRREIAREHLLEAWRDHLISTGDKAMGPLLAAHPNLDRQHLRQLLRNAAQEAAKNKPPAAARQIFKLLRELDAQEPLPPVPNN